MRRDGPVAAAMVIAAKKLQRPVKIQLDRNSDMEMYIYLLCLCSITFMCCFTHLTYGVLRSPKRYVKERL